MASFVINEQKFIDDNIFLYEERASSKYSRFLDKKPTFVTYYHINNDESTTDEGFQDVESIIGSRSPIKFQKIKDFPVYGLDPVILNLSDEEQGLDTSYESEVVVLPNTIKPQPNDFFIINHVNDSFIFRVKEIAYDSIRPDNFYKLSFKFEYLDNDKLDQLDKQVHEKYNCILTNIGSEEKCIVREDIYEQILAVNKLYDDISNTYISMFYSQKHDCLIGPLNPYTDVFDPLQSEFCNKHSLFNKKTEYNVIRLSTQFNDPKRKLKYEKSIYRFLERQDINQIKQFHYTVFPAYNNSETTFHRWHDNKTMIVDIPDTICTNKSNALLSLEFIDNVRLNKSMGSLYAETIKKYIRKDIKSIYDISLDLNDDLMTFCNSEELFIFTPIILFIIKKTLQNELK